MPSLVARAAVLILAFAACGVAAPSPETARRHLLIGLISGLTAEIAGPNLEAFRVGLRESGYQRLPEGRDVILEWRYMEGNEERAAEFAGEFLKAGVAIIVTGNPSGASRRPGMRRARFPF